MTFDHHLEGDGGSRVLKWGSYHEVKWDCTVVTRGEGVFRRHRPRNAQNKVDETGQYNYDI